MARPTKDAARQRDLARIAGSFLFEGIPAEAVCAALDRPGVTTETFPPETEIFSPGQDRRQLGILLTGEARVYKQAGTAQVLMSVLHPGDVTGAASLFAPAEDGDFTTTVIARKPVRMVLFSRSAVEALMQEDFRFTRNLLTYFTGRIRFLTGRIQSVASPTAAEKLLEYLRSHSADGSVSLTLSMTALCQSLRMGRASLYRAMEQLEQEGRIRREGKTIILADDDKI